MCTCTFILIRLSFRCCDFFVLYVLERPVDDCYDPPSHVVCFPFAFLRLYIVILFNTYTIGY